MEVVWSARRVARQLRRSDCILRRCCDQRIQEMSFTRRPGSGRLRQTSRREDHHIVRNAREQPAASSIAIQAHDDNHVRVWRPCGERLNPAIFTVTHHSPRWCDFMRRHYLEYAVTPGIDPWHHDSPEVCPRHPTTTCVATPATAPRSHFSTRQCSASHGKGVTRLSLHCYYPFLACPIPRFVSNRAHLGSNGMASWASYEIERTRYLERNVSRCHTERVCLHARSYRIVHSF
ncbi:transposable element Tcb1 transposase [Trichonephila clavipes]|nr:transposable element Tcb1 transposase [Trichonephila clavipes]